MGVLTVHVDQSWNFSNGPISGRSCSAFAGVDWVSPQLTAKSVWANGSYVTGPEVGEPNIRIMFRTDDDVLIYLDYLVRVHLPTHTPGDTPAIMSGRLEVDDTNDRYRWLNRTQVLGIGQLDMEAKTQTYQMSVLRWEGDIGPVVS
jgi:hypothetical protein